MGLFDRPTGDVFKIGATRLCVLLALCVSVAGCKTYPLVKAPPPEGQVRHELSQPFIPELNESGLFHLSCTDKYPTGQSVYAVFDADTAKLTRVDLAKRHFIHAAMANNVYMVPKEKPTFALPGWHLLESLVSETGFGVHVYGDAAEFDASQKFVVTYRGTDSLDDWGNNLSLTEPPQYEQAYKHLQDFKQKFPKAHVTVAGHSLGGGIALNMSMRVPGVDAVAFNTSPRVHFGRTSDLPNYRASLYEVGEFLNGAFGGWTFRKLPESTHYGNYNFLDYKTLKFSPIPEHSIYEIARALTVVAMTRGDRDAQRFFTANISEQQARETDWKNCQTYYANPDAPSNSGAK